MTAISRTRAIHSRNFRTFAFASDAGKENKINSTKGNNMALPQPIKPHNDGANIIETVMAKGDLSQLTPAERNSYYLAVCNSVGLNPLTRPLEYITLSGRMVLYARRDATDQLRTIHKVSIEDMQESEIDSVYIVTVKARNGEGRTDMAKGAVNVGNLKGEALANAMMKAETKAKRRVTLSLCGLGLLDETEALDVAASEKDKTMSKAKAKPIFAQMNDEMLGCKTPDDLIAWMNKDTTKERISVLPDDWQDVMRLDCKERLASLRDKTEPTGDVVLDELNR